MKKHLFIDGQILQTNALYRGMGVLLLQLLKATHKEAADIRTTVILNQAMPTSEAQLATIRDHLKGIEIVEAVITTPHRKGTYDQARLQLEAFIAAHRAYDEEALYLIPALFLFDYYAVFPENAKSVLLFHDLIPLTEWELMKRVFPGHIYFERLAMVHRANSIVTNSQSTAVEVQRLLGVAPSKTTFIGGSPKPMTGSAASHAKLLKKLGLEGKQYILMPSGGHAMHHKNSQRAIEAFYLLQRDVSREVILVTTSLYEEHEKAQLRAYVGDKVHFTGVVSAEEMDALFTGAGVVLVPSLAEGLGIPVLEAVVAGVPVACSNIPVFSELTDGADAFYSFDPFDVTDIRDKLFAALARVNFDAKQKHYSAINAKFKPAECAKRFVAALNAPEQTQPTQAPKRIVHVLAPSPAGDSNVGYMAQALSAGARQAGGFHLKYYLDPGRVAATEEARAADYVRYLEESHDVYRYIDHRINDQEAQIVFVSQSANFTKVFLLANSLKNHIVYIAGEVSEHMSDAISEDGLTATHIRVAEQAARKVAIDQGMFGYPALLAHCRAVIVEHEAVDAVRKTLLALGCDIPVLEVADNRRVSLGDYVVGDDPMPAILDFIAEVYA